MENLFGLLGRGQPKELLPANVGEADLFGRILNTGSAEINVVDIKTGRVAMVPGSSGLFSPRWSPDGRYLAAVSVDGSKKQCVITLRGRVGRSGPPKLILSTTPSDLRTVGTSTTKLF
jgi:dipeptidyl aminopeptidase/acylaminoacyl peptidase